MKASIPLAFVALTGVACAESGDPASVPAEGLAPDFEMWDSAGVHIVENARPPADSRLGWRVGEQPALSIGEVDGPDPYLLDISDVLRMPGGRIIVADRISRELRAFDTLGVHLATWGGTGEGPGEFTSLVHVDHWPGIRSLRVGRKGIACPFSTRRATTGARSACGTRFASVSKRYCRTA